MRQVPGSSARWLLSASVAALAVASVVTAAVADTVDTTTSWNGTSFISSWGVPNTATYGETITGTASRRSLRGFTFYLAQQAGTPPQYQAFVYAWDSVNRRLTGGALYTSAALTAPTTANANTYAPVAFDLTGAAVSLATGQQYVILLTTSTQVNGAGSTYRWGALTNNTTYPDGQFVFQNNGTNFGQLSTVSWSNIPEDLAMILKFDNIIDTAQPFYLSSALAVDLDPIFHGGTLRIDTGATLATDFTLDAIAGSTMDVNGTAVTFSGAFTGPGGLAFGDTAGGGSATLTNAGNTYTGVTTVNAGATLKLAGTSTIASSSGVVVNGTFDVSGAITPTITTLAGSGTVALGANVLTISAGFADTFSGVIGGTGGVTLTGSEIFTGTNTYTGTTTINGGSTLRLGAGGTTGSVAGAITNNGFLFIDRSDTVIVGNTISGGGALTKSGTNTVILTADNPFVGTTTIAGGTLQLGNGGTTGSVAGDVTDSGTLAINRSNTLTLGGVISGAGGLTQAGTGTTILTASNTYTGTTLISGGTLQIGSGGTTGSIAGAVTDNGTLAISRSDNITFANLVTGTGALNKLGANTVTLTADNTFTGTTTIAGGTLQLGNGGATGTVGGAVVDNGALVFNHNNAFILGGAISGTGSMVQAGTGTTALTGASTHTGGTTISAGTLQIGNGGTTGSIAGAITDNAALVINRSDAVTLANLISGSGTFMKAGTNTVTLTADNTYTGTTTIAGGTLQLGSGGTTGSVAGSITDNGTLAINRSNAMALANVISGTGGLAQNGTGTTTLTSTSTYSGATAVNAGTLIVNGSIANSAVTVNSGATLKGTGTVGALSAASGSTIAPGNSIGTLSVTGGLAFAAGSTYQVEINNAGAGDRINAGGAAALGGGAVTVNAAAGTYAISQTYRIINAAGGVTGNFGAVTIDMPILKASLIYSATAVDLKVILNDIDFGPLAQTPNEIAAAAAVKAGGPGSAVYGQMLANLPDTSYIGGALDLLDGEIHSSIRSGAQQDAFVIREGILDRLRSSTVGMSNGVNAAMLGDDLAVWVRGFTDWGSIQSDGNAGRIGQNFNGFMGGVDTDALGLNLGIAGGYSHTHVGANARNSVALGDNAHVAGYAGWTGGPVALRAGVEYGWGDLDMTRVVVFPGFTNTLTSTQEERTTQVFGEAGYAFGTPAIAAEAFGGVAWVGVDTGAFAETGGAGALSGPGSDSSITYTSLGLRLAPEPMGAQPFQVTPHISVAWEHAFGTLRPADVVTFIATAQSFQVAGAPLGRDGARAELGLDVQFSPSGKFGVGYEGLVSGGTQMHAVRADLTWNL